MKRLLVALTVMGTALVLASGVALAALNTINCPNQDNNRCVGTAQNDKLSGTPQADKMYGRGGHDLLVGFGGNDLQKGMNGDDILQGGPGNDRQFGGNGEDEVYGGTGNDLINIARDDDSDTAYCGAGYDIVKLDAQDIVGDEDGGTAGIKASRVLAGVQPIFNCEVLYIEGTLVVNSPLSSP